MAVRQVPWKFLMELLREVRNSFYKKDRPDVKQFVLPDVTAEELDTRLREEAYFEEAEEYTYKYEGEILNLRRPAGLMDGYQMACHLRAFEHEQGLEILVHYEVSRFNHPKEHLDGLGFSWDKGEKILTDVFDDLDIKYEDLG